MKSSKIFILHQFVPFDANPDEMDVLLQANEIGAALQMSGYSTEALPVAGDISFLKKLKKAAKVVFNLVETLNGSAVNSHLVPSILEQNKIKYTGNSPDAVFVTTDKTLTKEILKTNGIPTPGWYSKEKSDHFEPGNYIFKPVAEDASIGITEESIKTVTTAQGAAKLISQFENRYKMDYFCEKFVEGREFNVSIIGNKGKPEVLTPAEMLFLKSGIENNILCYDSKWNEESGKYKNSARSFGFQESDRELLELLKRYSRDCWSVFGLSGYARVDFRVDRNNRPFVIEINANPCLSPDGGFFAAAQNEGMNYQEMINRILAEAQL